MICLCAGVTSYLALKLIGVPYPALRATVITGLDAIPQVGATIGATLAGVVGAIVALPVAAAGSLVLRSMAPGRRWGADPVTDQRD